MKPNERVLTKLSPAQLRQALVRKRKRKAASKKSAEHLRYLSRRELHRREAANDINRFIEYAFTTPEGGPFQQGAMHREWQGLLDKHSRVIIVAPRGHGKTSQIPIVRPIYHLGRNINERVKLLCQADTKAVKRLQEIRTNVLDNELVHKVFPALHPSRLVEENKHQLRWDRPLTAKDPSIDVAGITSSASGDRATIMIADDVVDRRNAITLPKIRDQIKEAWDDWVNLLMPGGKLWYICTLWHHCIPAHEPVLTDRGRVYACELDDHLLRVGPGKWERPQAITKKPFDGELVSVRVVGQPAPYRFTEGHRLPTTRGLLKASELRVGDEMVLDLGDGQDIMDSAELLALEPKEAPPRQDPPTSEAKLRKRKCRVSREQLKADLDAGMTYGEIAAKHKYLRNGKPNKSHVLWMIKHYGLPRRRAHNVATEGWILRPEFWKFAGYWLAEGCYNQKNYRTRLTFGFSESELKLVADAAECIRSSIGVEPRITPQHHSTSVRVNCRLVGQWLIDTFGSGEIHKRLPAWIERLPRDLLREFILGYWLGDGCESFAGIRFATSSMDLAYDVARVLATGFGVVAQHYKSDRTTGTGFVTVAHEAHEVRITRADALTVGLPVTPPKLIKRKKLRVEDGRAIYPIKEIAREPYKGDVYDVATSTGYFDLAGLTSHNSDLSHMLMKRAAYKVGWYEIDLENFGSYVKLPDGTERRSKSPLWTPDDGGPWSAEALLERKEEIGSRAFARGFSNRPMSEDEQRVDPSWIKLWVEPPTREWPLVIGLDLATTKKKSSDWTGIVVMAVHPWVVSGQGEPPENLKGAIKVVDAWHAKISFPRKADLVKELVKRYRAAGLEVDRVVIERAAGGVELAETLGEQTTIPLMGVTPRHKKEDRFDRITPYIERGIIEWNPKLDPALPTITDERGDLIGEVLAFPLSTKDIADAFVHCVRFATVTYEGFLGALTYEDGEEPAEQASTARIMVF